MQERQSFVFDGFVNLRLLWLVFIILPGLYYTLVVSSCMNVKD